MLNLFRKDTLTPQTERIYKVPLCIQDTIPIYRIAENGIFELESPTNKDGGKKKLHQFDRMYLSVTRSSYPIIMPITESCGRRSCRRQ